MEWCGASLSKEELKEWESEHLKMLSEAAPEEFDIKHYMALVELQTRKKDYVECICKHKKGEKKHEE